MKPVLMIHEVNEQMLELPLSDYILTFDDGLYSQFYYLDKFRQFNTEMIFFISSGIVCNGRQSTNFPTCVDAHKKAALGDFEDYMTLDQIKQLANTPNVSIGGHSHVHKDMRNSSKQVEKITHIKSDTEKMVSWFEQNLGFKPTKFCFPYNEEYNGLYSGMLKYYGITELYGRGRIAIEDLLHTASRPACHGA